MTIITTIITRHCTAHASDSFLTGIGPDGAEVIEAQASKIIRVEALRGAIAYWGLARNGSWKTLQWLTDYSAKAHKYGSAEKFALEIASDLTKEIGGRAMANCHRGLGIHFSAYEHIDDRWIPELFVITNYEDASYSTLRTTGFRVTRETSGTIVVTGERSLVDNAKSRRLAFHASLHDGPIMLQYFNGDPTLFMPLAKATLDAFRQLSSRGVLREPESTATHRSIASRPVELMSRLVGDFAKESSRYVGGKTHSLSVTPGGLFESDAGD